MRYFTFSEISRALICSSILGLLAGGIYNSLSTLFSCVYRLLSLGRAVIRSTSVSQCRVHASIDNEHSVLAMGVFDFIFFTVLGCAHILFCYLTMDGIFRFYILITSIIAFFVSKKIFGAIFEAVIVRIYTAIYCMSFAVVFVLTYPLRLIWRLTKRIFSAPIKRAEKVITTLIISRLIAKKQKQIFIFFKSA